MAKKKITVLAEELLSGFLQEEGLELYHSEFVKEGKDWFLRIYIDKPEGEGYIGTEDCEKVSRFLSEKLWSRTTTWRFLRRAWIGSWSNRNITRDILAVRWRSGSIRARTALKIYKGSCRQWKVIPLPCRITTEKNGICSLLKSQRQSWQLFSKVGGKKYE